MLLQLLLLITYKNQNLRHYDVIIFFAMLGFVIIAPLCLQNLSTVQLISWNLNEFPQFSIRRQVENNWLPWQHLRTKENFKTCKIILNGVKKNL